MSLGRCRSRRRDRRGRRRRRWGRRWGRRWRRGLGRGFFLGCRFLHDFFLGCCFFLRDFFLWRREQDGCCQSQKSFQQFAHHVLPLTRIRCPMPKRLGVIHNQARALIRTTCHANTCTCGYASASQMVFTLSIAWHLLSASANPDTCAEYSTHRACFQDPHHWIGGSLLRDTRTIQGKETRLSKHPFLSSFVSPIKARSPARPQTSH